MNTAHPLSMGDRGRLVIPQDIRERHGWTTGTPLVSIDTDAGVVVMSVDEGLAWIRGRLQGRDLVAELLRERSEEASGE